MCIEHCEAEAPTVRSSGIRTQILSRWLFTLP
jgi:hypothetical protein